MKFINGIKVKQNALASYYFTNNMVGDGVYILRNKFSGKLNRRCFR